MAKLDSIHIDVGLKRIAINNDPDRIIEFNPQDVIFAEKFYDLISNFEEKLDEFKTRSEELEAVKEVDAIGTPINMTERFALVRDACEFIKERIDHLFGEGTSKVAFEDAVSLDMFVQFFNGITPFIKAARSEKMAQYIGGKKPSKVMK